MISSYFIKRHCIASAVSELKIANAIIRKIAVELKFLSSLLIGFDQMLLLA